MAKMNPSKLRNVLEALPSCDLPNTKKKAIEAIITKYLEGDIVPVVHGRLLPSIAEANCTCSVCRTEFDNILSKAVKTWNCCPICGAKMDNPEKIKCQGS